MTDPVVLDLTADDARSSAEFWLDWAKGTEWSFASYYKYTFTFTARGGLLILAPGQAEGVPFTATATCGGDSGDIYRWHVADPMTWSDICEGGEPDLTIRTDGGVLFSTNPYLMPKRDEEAEVA